MRVDEALPHFRGHFPGRAVLAAAAQIDVLVVPCAVRSWPDLGPLRAGRKVKLSAPIAPGDVVAVDVVRATDEPQVSFRIERDGKLCASGTLVFERRGAT